jgi:hypothetical protein
MQPQDQSRRRDVMSPWANACPDRLLNRERFAGRRVGTILCGSNVSSADFARWVLGNG